MPTPGTTNTPIRLTAEDRRKIEELRELYGLPSLASTVRHTVELAYRAMQKSARKSRVDP